MEAVWSCPARLSVRRGFRTWMRKLRREGERMCLREPTTLRRGGAANSRRREAAKPRSGRKPFQLRFTWDASTSSPSASEAFHSCPHSAQQSCGCVFLSIHEKTTGSQILSTLELRGIFLANINNAVSIPVCFIFIFCSMLFYCLFFFLDFI